jgi:hypothetical protein
MKNYNEQMDQEFKKIRKLIEQMNKQIQRSINKNGRATITRKYL